jgi:hypothetical protein|nr:MAG TPA: hypothetical protein [Caudoviricetes sp.]
MVKLSKEEAERLLNMIKNSLVDSINFPNLGELVEFNAKGDTDKDIFTLSIYRGKINGNKICHNARIAKNGIILLALDVCDNGCHQNPDGTKITGSHWHIYTEEFGRKLAYKAEDINSKDFVNNSLIFFEKFNLIQHPAIMIQEKLDI